MCRTLQTIPDGFTIEQFNALNEFTSLAQAAQAWNAYMQLAGDNSVEAKAVLTKLLNAVKIQVALVK